MINEQIYLYRRKGLSDYATCDRARYVELSQHKLFETMICYASAEAAERLGIDLELTRLARQGDQIEIDGLKALNDGLRAELGECKGEYDRAVNKVDVLQELSVTNILLDVVPGHDGMGHEVFAKSVAEVCEKLGDFAMQSEDIQQSLTDTERRLHEVADYCATVEQRNADLEKLIAEAHAWVDHNNFGGTDAYDLRDRLAAAIKTAGAANKESAQ